MLRVVISERWPDPIEARGAICFVIDPREFRIIKDSSNKTDKQDARNLAKALRVQVVTGDFGIPVATNRRWWFGS